MLKASMVIATYNRPKELVDAIQSLLDGTVLPYEILVLDDGELPDHPMEEECFRAGVGYIFHKKKVRGLTESRNVGVSLASGEVICFVDDDVICDPHYLEEILRTYEEQEGKWGKPIGGVGGVIYPPEHFGKREHVMYYYNLFFMIVGPKEGRALPSGFCADYYHTPNPLKEITSVDFFSGGVCSYRKEIFDSFTFTPGYRAHAFGEDKDFSCQVSKEYTLLMNPKAKLNHLEAPSMRPDKRKEGHMFIMGRYLFFKLCVKKGWWSWLFFFYALFGYALARLAALVVFPNRSKLNRMRGMFSAIGTILVGKGPHLEHVRKGVKKVEGRQI